MVGERDDVRPFVFKLRDDSSKLKLDKLKHDLAADFSITNQQLIVGLNDSPQHSTGLFPFKPTNNTRFSPLTPANVAGLQPLSPAIIANTMHNLVGNTVNIILGRQPNDFVDSSTGIGALSAGLVHNLLVKPVKHKAWIVSFKFNSLKFGSFRLAPNSYANLALVIGLLFQLLNPLVVFAYKEGDFPGVGHEAAWDNAVTYYNQGVHTNGEAACKLYLKAISIYPYEAAFWINLGSETKDSNKKIEYYQKALKLNPEHADPYIGLSVTYAKLGRHEDAINYYQKALKLEPNNGRLYNGIGNEYLALKKYKEAMPYFKRLTELNPEVEDGFYNLGLCLFFTHNYTEAIELCRRSLIISPNDWAPNEVIGLSLYKMGKIKEGLFFKDKAYSLAKSKEDKEMIIKDFADAKSGKI